jgi:hypothetical protein
MQLGLFFFLVGCFFLSTRILAQDERVEIVGDYQYTYSDNQSLEQARQIAYTLAVRKAVESLPVFTEETATINDPAVIKALVQTITSGYMHDLQIVEQNQEGRRVSCKVRAYVEPAVIKNVIVRELSRLQVREPEAIDENQHIRILAVKEFLEEEPKKKRTLRRLEVVYQQKGNDSTPILIDFYDAHGKPLYGRRVSSQEFLIPGEIRQVFFTLPDEARSYRIWLKK